MPKKKKSSKRDGKKGSADTETIVSPWPSVSLDPESLTFEDIITYQNHVDTNLQKDLKWYVVQEKYVFQWDKWLYVNTHAKTKHHAMERPHRDPLEQIGYKSVTHTKVFDENERWDRIKDWGKYCMVQLEDGQTIPLKLYLNAHIITLLKDHPYVIVVDSTGSHRRFEHILEFPKYDNQQFYLVDVGATSDHVQLTRMDLAHGNGFAQTLKLH